MTYEMHIYFELKLYLLTEEIAQFLEEGQAPKGMSDKKKKILEMKYAPYTIVNRFLYKIGLNDVL